MSKYGGRFEISRKEHKKNLRKVYKEGKSKVIQAIPSRPSKKEDKEAPIEVKPFTGIGNVNPINIADYSNLSEFILKRLNPSEDLKKPVVDIMVSMFLNISDVYEKGKYPPKRVRDYAKEQFRVFQDSLSVLEVSSYPANLILRKGRIGDFSNKEKYRIRDNKELVKSDLFKGESSYHIVYLGGPSNMKCYEAADVAEGVVRDKYSKIYNEQAKVIESYIEKEEIVELEKKIRGFVEGAEDSELFKKVREVLETRTDLTELQIEFLNETLKIEGPYERAMRESKEIEPRIPVNTQDILNLIGKSVLPGGVLITDASDMKDFPEGFGIIDCYDQFSWYQKAISSEVGSPQ
ncbi:hypothetical protein KY332_01395 [Candidatus Woesearchaeota archaeon]|nr:hypothetical protein [Candidatus Woesearchaeota archaeon]